MIEAKRLSAYAEALLREWDVPSASISIVNLKADRSTEHKIALNFGSKSADLYNIGSVSKSFTAFAVGLLVDDGLLRWDTRVREVLPDFKVVDAEVTQAATITDLLSHRTGLARWQPFVSSFVPSDTRAQDLAQLPMWTNSQSFRSGNVYSNLCFNILAEIIAKCSGLSFEDFVQQRIFDALGMTNATYRPKAEDVATPALALKGATYKIDPLRSQDDPQDSAVSSAGGIYVSGEDAFKWMQYFVCASSKKADDFKPLMSEQQWKHIITPHNDSYAFCGTPYGTDFLDGVKPGGYCCALDRANYQGVDLVHHNGVMLGSGTQFIMAPEAGFAVFVTCSAAGRGNAVASVLALYALEKTLDLPAIDWNARFKSVPIFANGRLPLEIAHVDDRSADDFLPYCGTYEVNENNRVIVFSAHTMLGALPFIETITDKFKNSKDLHPYPTDQSPKLYMCSGTNSRLETLTHYMALIPVARNKFRAVSRFFAPAGNVTYNVERACVSRQGDMHVEFQTGSFIFTFWDGELELKRIDN